MYSRIWGLSIGLPYILYRVSLSGVSSLSPSLSEIAEPFLAGKAASMFAITCGLPISIPEASSPGKLGAFDLRRELAPKQRRLSGQSLWRLVHGAEIGCGKPMRADEILPLFLIFEVASYPVRFLLF